MFHYFNKLNIIKAAIASKNGAKLLTAIILSMTTAPLAAFDIVPTDLTAGQQYRLVFTSSDRRDATSAAIGDYNTFVNDLANTALTETVQAATTWTAIVSTPTVDARDNTNTDNTAPDDAFGNGTGVPIYRINGSAMTVQRIADDNADLWDGLLALSVGFNEFGGIDALHGNWTGTLTDGTGNTGLELGSTGNARTAIKNSASSTWIFGAAFGQTNDQRIYGISSILTVEGEVAAVPEPSTYMLMGSMLMTAGVLRRRQQRAHIQR
jgi:hypothetical protein